MLACVLVLAWGIAQAPELDRELAEPRSYRLSFEFTEQGGPGSIHLEDTWVFRQPIDEQPELDPDEDMPPPPPGIRLELSRQWERFLLDGLDIPIDPEIHVPMIQHEYRLPDGLVSHRAPNPVDPSLHWRFERLLEIGLPNEAFRPGMRYTYSPPGTLTVELPTLTVTAEVISVDPQGIRLELTARESGQNGFEASGEATLDPVSFWPTEVIWGVAPVPLPGDPERIPHALRMTMRAS